MIDRYAGGQQARIAAPPGQATIATCPAELTPLHLDRDERLAGERSAA